METSLQSGGRFRSQRIVPPIWRAFPQPADFSSNLEGISAASGLLLQSGGRFLLQYFAPAKVQEVFEVTFWMKIVLFIINR